MRMATRSRRRKKRSRVPKTRTPGALRSPQVPQPPTAPVAEPEQEAKAEAKPQSKTESAANQPESATPESKPQKSNTIRKGIYLSALIYIEGAMPAPDDFITPTTTALKSVLSDALKGEHDGLTMTLKKVEI